MTTENMEVSEEEVIEQPEQEIEEVQQSEATPEDIAREKGWVPKDEYKGDKSDWVGAEAFLARGPLMDHIKKLNKQVKAIGNFNQQLNDKIVESERRGYERAIKELKTQQKVALREGDEQAVENIGNEIASFEEELNQHKQAAQQIKPEVASFARKNQEWFGKDQRLTKLAISLEGVIQAENPDFDDDELYAELHERMAKYTGKAPAEERKTKPSYVSPVKNRVSGATETTKKSYTQNDLNDQAKDIFKGLLSAQPGLTVDSFIKNAKELGMDAELLRGKK